MIGERREARTKSQAQRTHRNVGIKGHSKLMLCPLVLYIHSYVTKYAIYDNTDNYFLGGR